jgi:predicted nucleotidyltransferase
MFMLERLFGSKTRVGILVALVCDGRRLRLLELQRVVGTSVSSVQKELEVLESVGLVKSEREGDARYLVAVPSHPLTVPLRELLEADRASQSVMGVNPAVAPKVPQIIDACRRHGAQYVALVGSATETDPAVRPKDLDLLVRLAPTPSGYARRYFELLSELEQIMGMPVEIIEEVGVVNPYLRAEFEATKVVLYEAA